MSSIGSSRDVGMDRGRGGSELAFAALSALLMLVALAAIAATAKAERSGHPAELHETSPGSVLITGNVTTRGPRIAAGVAF